MATSKNIGIWIRVSTDMQVQGDSPEHHEHRARQYADLKDWNIITVYRLDAMSGKSIMEYAETKRMLKDIANGTISGIIFSKLARLARNTKELLEISELFRESNADLISLSENIDTSSPAGRLFFTIIAAMAQWEREEIAERVAASVPVRAQMGKPLGGAASFGYRWSGHELQIDEQEAPIRKLIYELFIKNKRKLTTAKELNELGYRTRNGSEFSATTVNRLLQDTTAKGIRLANYTKSLGEGKNWAIKPEKDWIKIPCPAVIHEDIWNEANAILLQQERKKNVDGPKTLYLLTGYLHCSCGRKMYVFTESLVFKCKKCKRKIAVSDIDEIYHEQLKAFLLTDSDSDNFNQRFEDTILEKEALLKSLRSEQAKLQKKISNLIDLRSGGELSKEDFAAAYKPAETQLRQLEIQLPELEAEIDFTKIQQLSSDTIAQDAKDLYTNWPILPFEEKRGIIEAITDKIVIHNDTIDIALSYSPNPTTSLNAGNSARNLRDS